MRWCCTGWCYLSHNDVTDNMARYLEPDHPNRPSATIGDSTLLQEGINLATREREAPFIKSNFKDHEERRAYRARVSETMDVPLFVKIVDLPSTVDLGWLTQGHFELLGTRWDTDDDVVNTAAGYAVPNAGNFTATEAA